jgi:phosphonate transport system substrate-binding protein
MIRQKVRVASFLAPNMWPIYEFIVGYISSKLNYEMELVVGSTYDELGHSDFSFVCGLPYVLYTAPRLEPSPITAIAAPVLQGERYQGKPIYFSDVIVRADSSIRSFADLRGHSWAYNEDQSQSGYGITRYWLVKFGETNGYFGKVVKAGFHQAAIRMVSTGEVDASAIDSLVLAVELAKHQKLTQKLRIVETLGPSTIQPFVAATHVPQSLKDDVQGILAQMHIDSMAAEYLRRGHIDHFVPMQDSDYDDIRAMLAACEAANFMTLK